MRRLPAEWEPQVAVILSWPHANTDWASQLRDVTDVYIELVSHLLNFTPVLVLSDSDSLELVQRQLRIVTAASPHKLWIKALNTQDTWVRDYGPITLEHEGKLTILDCPFNRRGNAEGSALDSHINSHLAAMGVFGDTQLEKRPFALEGGAIESDGQGTLLTSQQCLLNSNRSGDMSKASVEAQLKDALGAQHILWISRGSLQGDSTHGHIDMLARLAPNNTILYVTCNDPQDPNYAELKAMEEEIQRFRTQHGQAFSLIPLPSPLPQFSRDGVRLPATYANYLVSNDAVLVPNYHDPHDQIAMMQISKAFPDRNVIGVFCNPLMERRGSLHCITMQLPAGVF